MKILIDTNVLISALLKDGQPENAILWVLEQAEWEWFASPSIMQEYQEVLRRKKFRFPAPLVQHWSKLLNDSVNIIVPDIQIDFPRDRKDAKFLECAKASCADVFITGDKDFSEAQKLIDTRIFNPSGFLQLFREA